MDDERFGKSPARSEFGVRFWLFVLVVIAVGGGLLAATSRVQSGNDARTAAALAELEVSAREIDDQMLRLESLAQGVTMHDYARLQTGMRYDQAVEIIGSPGEEVSRNEIAGITTVMVIWSNPDGSNMNAMFQNGGLVQKAQFGLR